MINTIRKTQRLNLKVIDDTTRVVLCPLGWDVIFEYNKQIKFLPKERKTLKNIPFIIDTGNNQMNTDVLLMTVNIIEDCQITM